MMNKLGVLVSTETMNTAALSEFAQTLETRGYESLWLPELFGREPLSTAGYLLAATSSLKIATGIANIYSRDPSAMAQSRQTLGELSNGRFMLGLGVSNPGLNSVRGHQWEMPLPKMRRYLKEMAEVQVEAPKPENQAPLYIAAHGPKLQALGANHTDGIITYLMPMEHAAQSRARIGDAVSLSVVCGFLHETDPTVARNKARKALSFYITLDYYQREWQAQGFDLSDYEGGGSDRLIDALVGWGDQRALQDRVDRFKDAGVDRVIVMPFDAVQKDRNSLTLLAESAG